MSLFESLIRRPVSVLIGTATLVVLGVVAAARLPVALLPTLERPRLEVDLPAAGLSPDQVLVRVEQLERELLGIEGGQRLRTRIDGDGARLVLETEWQTDPDLLRIEVERRLVGAGEIANATGLEVRVDAADPLPVLEIGVVRGTPTAARRVADEILVPELARLPGAGRVEVRGGALRRVVVRPRAADLASRGLTAADVAERLRGLDGIRTIGVVRDGAEARSLVVRHSPESLAELRAVRLGSDASVRLDDIADVAIEDTPVDSRFRLDGRPAVLVELHRAPGANAVTLATEAVARVGELGSHFVVLRDVRREVLEAVGQLALAGALGLLLGAAALRFLLGSWRPTFGLILVVPTSLAITLGLFHLLGLGLDVMSLAGLALATGMLVDSAIVVIDAIESARRAGADEDVDDAVLVARGCREIAPAVVAGLLTTAVVFVPLLYLEGLARAFFGVQALAITSSLGVALLLSLSLTPVLVHLAGSGGGAKGRHPGRGALLGLLRRALPRPATVAVAALLLSAGALFLLADLPRRLVPEGESAVLDVELRSPPAADDLAVARTLDRLDASWSGLAELERRRILVLPPSDTTDLDAVDVRVELTFASAEARRRAGPVVRDRMGELPGWRGTAVTRRTAIVSALERGARGLELEVAAATPDRAADLGRRWAELVAPRIGRPRSAVAETAERGDEWALTWSPGRTSVALDRLGEQVRAGLGRMETGIVLGDAAEPEILLEAVEAADLGRIPVAAREGEVVPLAAVARWRRTPSRPVHWRVDGRPADVLRWDPNEGADAKRRVLLDEVARWSGARDERVRLAGSAEEMRRSFGQLRFALALACVLVVLAVAAIYESWRLPAVVFSTVPVALAGASLALHLAGASLDVVALLGFVLLAGIVVNNAIVLVDRLERRRAAGEDAATAALGAARERYRPILATTVTTLAGLVPLAWLGGEGEELRRALVLVLGGGISAAWIGTLVVVPVLARLGGGREGALPDGNREAPAPTRESVE